MAMTASPTCTPRRDPRAHCIDDPSRVHARHVGRRVHLLLLGPGAVPGHCVRGVHRCRVYPHAHVAGAGVDVRELDDFQCFRAAVHHNADCTHVRLLTLYEPISTAPDAATHARQPRWSSAPCGHAWPTVAPGQWRGRPPGRPWEQTGLTRAVTVRPRAGATASAPRRPTPRWLSGCAGPRPAAPPPR